MTVKPAANTLPTLANLPAYQCYDCVGCGDCCRGLFAIRLTEADYARITAQGWENDPELHGQTLFTKQDDGHRMAHREDGSCVFLNERGLCRIHAKFGEPAKPLACRLYPFIYVPVGNELRIDVRFDCPQVAGSRGRSITTYRADLREMLPQWVEEMLKEKLQKASQQAVPVQSWELPAPPLFARVTLPWTHLLRIEQAMEKLLTRTDLDFTRRLVCMANLTAALRTPRLAGVEMKKLDELLAKLTAMVVEKVKGDALVRLAPPGLTRAMFRQMLAAYGRADRIGQRPNVWQRLTVGLRMLNGRGTMPPIRPGFPPVRFADLEGAFGLPDEEATAPLVRYYRVHLQSMGFCGPIFYGRAFLDGLGMLCLTYPLICWFARAFAVAEGHPALTAQHVERAIAVVDHQHGRNKLFDLPSERYRQHALLDRSTLRSLIVWYGS